MKKQGDEKAAFEERLKAAVVKKFLKEGRKREDSFDEDDSPQGGPIELLYMKVLFSNQPVGIFEVKGRMMAVRLPITLPFCV